MRRYRATLTAWFEIEAENIVQARHAAKRIRALGDHAGCRRVGDHDRDMTRYSVTSEGASLIVRRRGGRGGEK